MIELLIIQIKCPEKTIFLDDLKDVKRAYFARDNEWLRRQGAFYRFFLKFDPYATIIAFFINLYISIGYRRKENI